MKKIKAYGEPPTRVIRVLCLQRDGPAFGPPRLANHPCHANPGSTRQVSLSMSCSEATGGPLRYRVRHEVPLWQVGERPRMRQMVVEGDPGPAV